jgi:peptidoglycan/LPS O-acetylase OafA/YrhL
MFLGDFLFALGGIIVATAVIKPFSGIVKKTGLYIGRKSYLIYLYHEPTMKYLLKFIFPGWINL